MKRFIVGLVCFSLIATQTGGFAGVHDEGVAAGQAANPLIRGTITAPSATTHVPGYTSTPSERALYKAPNLPAQANARLLSCALTPLDPVCQAQQGAVRSANTPRPAIGPHDPAVAAARGIARNPGTVLGDLSSFYSGCSTTTITSPPGNVSRMCNRYTGVGTYSCKRELTVDTTLTPSCEIGSLVASAQTSRNRWDHMYARVTCRVDGPLRFQFYAHGSDGACMDWQSAALPRGTLSEPLVVADLSPHWGGSCWSPFKVVATAGSGCSGGHCNFSFQFGTPVYGCRAGETVGDQLMLGGTPDSPAPGDPAFCYSTSTPISADAGLSCPPPSVLTVDTVGNSVCAERQGYSRIIGASGWTLPMSFAEPRLLTTATDRWDDKCPVLDPAGRCAATTADRCIEGPSTKTIGGVPVHRPCWAYERTMLCAGGAESNECAPLAAAGCTPSASVCVKTDPATGTCAVYQDTYQCPAPAETITTASNCPTDVFCLGTSCFNVAHAADGDFARSMAYMEAAREAGVYMDPNKLTVFDGERQQCRDRLLKNCCFTDGSGKSMTNQSAFGVGSRLVYDVLMNSENRQFVTAGLQALISGGGFAGSFSSYGFTIALNGTALPAGSVALYESSLIAGEGVVIAFDPWSLAIAVIIHVVMSLMECNETEGRLALQRGAGLCHEVGSYCSHRILTACVTETHTHCCFNSLLSRLINEQGRVQIGRDWGDARNPKCGGFSVAELQSLRFDAMDFSEFYASIVPTTPNVSAIQGNNNSRVPACYYGQGKC